MLSFHPQLFAYLLIFSAAMANYAVAQDGQPNPELATKAGAVLNDFCFRCHRGEGSSAGGYAFNARDVASMTDESVVTPESLEDSDL